MFRKVALHNFRGVSEGNVELWPFTLMVGRNNSGKTTVLEALFLAPDPFRSVFGGYSPPLKEGKDTALHCLAYLHESLDSTGFRFLLRDYIAKKSEIHYYLASENAFIGRDFYLIFERKEADLCWVSYALPYYKPEGELEQVVEENVGSFHLDSYTVNTGQSPPTEIREMEVLFLRSDLMRLYWRMFKRRWVDISNMGIGSTVAPKISELVEENYDDLTLEPFGGGLTIYLRKSNGKRIRISDLGDGAQLFLTALILKELVKPKVMLWDDLEAHMNPQMITRALEWLAGLVKEGVQVVATTHSMEVLSKALALMEVEGLEKLFRVLLLQLRDGKLMSKPLSWDEASKLIEGGLDIRLAGSLL